MFLDAGYAGSNGRGGGCGIQPQRRARAYPNDDDGFAVGDQLSSSPNQTPVAATMAEMPLRGRIRTRVCFKRSSS